MLRLAFLICFAGAFCLVPRTVDAYQANNGLVPYPREPDGLRYSTAFQDALKTKSGASTFLDGSPGVVPLVRDLESSLKNSRTQKNRRLNSLKDRIDQLRILLDEDRKRREQDAARKRAQQQAKAAAAPKPAEEEPPAEPEADLSPEAVKLIQDALNPPEPDPKPITKAHATDLLQQISEKPIDRLRLADSLFAINQLQMSLDIYEQLDDSTSSTSEQIWIRYQRASCLRRLKKIDSARRYYRAVAGIDESDFLGECSRWWLDTLDERQGLEQKVENIQSTIEALEAEINGGKPRAKANTVTGGNGAGA